MLKTYRRFASIFAPSKSYFDESIAVSIEGLKAKQNVAVVAQASVKDVTVTSVANFTADDTGVVSLVDQEALPGGTYTGIHPMGLFWSMEMTSKLQNPFKMLSGTKLEKWKYQIEVHDGHASGIENAKELLSNQSMITKTEIERYFVPDSCKRIVVNDNRLRGVLYIPEGGGSGLIPYRGGLFARHGYACLCLAYGNYKDLPPLEKLDFSYFEEGYKYLCEQQFIDRNRIGIYGLCWGGTIALVLARLLPDIKGVVALSPEPLASCVDFLMKGEIVPGVQWDPINLKAKHGAIECRGTYKPNLESKGPWTKYNLNLGMSKAPLLIFQGADNRLFDLGLYTNILIEQMIAVEKTNYEIIVLPDAGHNLHAPFLPAFQKFEHQFYFHDLHFMTLYGTNRPGHAKAQERAWQKSLQFFNHNLQG